MSRRDPNRALAHQFLTIRGPYPELPTNTVVITVSDWEGGVLCEFTLGDLQALKQMIESDSNDEQSKPPRPGGRS